MNDEYTPTTEDVRQALEIAAEQFARDLGLEGGREVLAVTVGFDRWRANDRADAVMAFASHCLKYPEWLLARTWAEQIRNGEHD